MYESVVDCDKLSYQLYHTYSFFFFFLLLFFFGFKPFSAWLFMFIFILRIYFKKNYLLQEEATYLCSADRAISMCQCSKVRVQHGSFPPHIVKNTFLSTSNRSKVSLMFFTFFGGAHPPLPSPTQQQSNGNKLCSMLDFIPHPHNQGSSAIAFK